MKTILFATVLAAITFATTAQAQILDISFTGNNSAANGQITVVNGIATSGYLDVTFGDNTGTYALVSLTSSLINGEASGDTKTIRFVGGTDEIFDNIVNIGSDPFLTDDGLVFANDHSIGFNLWGNSPGSYSLFDVGEGNAVYETDNGTTTATVVVPEPLSWALLLGGLVLLAYGQSRRRRYNS